MQLANGYVATDLEYYENAGSKVIITPYTIHSICRLYKDIPSMFENEIVKNTVQNKHNIDFKLAIYNYDIDKYITLKLIIRNDKIYSISYLIDNADQQNITNNLNSDVTRPCDMYAFKKQKHATNFLRQLTKQLEKEIIRWKN
jgi:hypothetical protein